MLGKETKECVNCDFSTLGIIVPDTSEWSYCPQCGSPLGKLDVEIPINEEDTETDDEDVKTDDEDNSQLADDTASTDDDSEEIGDIDEALNDSSIEDELDRLRDNT